MILPTDKLGSVYEGGPYVIDVAAATAYDAATNAENPAYATGRCVPPVFGAVVAWDALATAVADTLSPESLMTQVHGEHDMHFHRPLVPGMRLVSRAEAFSLRVGRSGARCTLRAVSVDDDGRVTLARSFR
jgi:hypothetical protein